jgi:hypothetical protein
LQAAIYTLLLSVVIVLSVWTKSSERGQKIADEEGRIVWSRVAD